MVTLTSSSTSNTTFDLLSSNNSNSLRDVSFSSYLKNNNEETFIQKLSESSRSLKGPNSVPQEDRLGYNSIGSARMKKETEDSEIGVFGAEKYFKGEMDSDSSPRLVSQTKPEIYRYVKPERAVANSRANTKSSVGTPSVQSESSWNSQSALLQNLAKNSNHPNSLHQKMNNKGNKKSFLANLGCSCSCSDGNSVDVDETSSTKKSNSGFLVQENAAKDLNLSTKTNGLSKENLLTFPTMISEAGSANLKTRPKFLEKEEEEIQRKSLDVFGSPVLEKRNKSLSIEKKLPTSINPWDSNPRINDEFSTNYEDTGSDASSDLFEIESLTGKAKTFLARQGSDPASPTCYAPSEASIEWSVVTASAADFSAMSDYATSPIRNKASANYPNSNIKSNKEMRRRRSSSSLLLGCKSQKAVRVSGDSYRTTGQNVNYVKKFQTEGNKPAGFEARNKIVSRTISHSPSPRASHLLYIP